MCPEPGKILIDIGEKIVFLIMYFIKINQRDDPAPGGPDRKRESLFSVLNF